VNEFVVICVVKHTATHFNNIYDMTVTLINYNNNLSALLVGWRRLHNKSFMICTPYQIIFGLSHQENGDMLGMCRNGREGRCIVFW